MHTIGAAHVHHPGRPRREHGAQQLLGAEELDATVAGGQARALDPLAIVLREPIHRTSMGAPGGRSERVRGLTAHGPILRVIRIDARVVIPDCAAARIG